MTMHRILPLAACLLALGVAPAFAAAPAQTERGSARYTDALNAFMAHGWHAVSHMRQKGGMIVATGVNARDQVRGITFDPGSDSVHAS
ncbi:MAG: hypothetical protein BGP12_05385 [Rhodospirillales bacterium 70-18]|nr:MAG: hypothetical protein BGP12_05385 [Rhodospirillales bacterium 70-18]